MKTHSLFLAALLLTPLTTLTAADDKAATTLSPDAFGVTTRTPPVIKVDPGPKYWPRLRMWQGIPSIERTAKGRLWATWYAGPLSEGSTGNHSLLVTSDDDGKTWSNPVAVYDPSTFFEGSTGDPNLWIDPQGRLWWFVFRVLKVQHPDGIRSLWGFCTENPDDPSPKWNAPVLAGFGLGLNKPTVLSNGDWLRPLDNNHESKQGRSCRNARSSGGKMLHEAGPHLCPTSGAFFTVKTPVPGCRSMSPFQQRRLTSGMW